MDGYECETMVDQLYAFLDDALNVQMTLKTQRHLETCPTCFQRYQFILNMRHLLREEAETFPTPPRLEDRIRRLGRTRLARTKSWRILRKPVPLVAAITLLVLVATAVFLHTSFRQADLVPRLIAYHRAILHETVPMRLHTSNPQQVTAWLREQVPFQVDIPQDGLEGFRLIGATAIPLVASRGAYVLYKRQAEGLAYLVFRDEGMAIPAGKEAVIGPHTLSLHQEAGFMLGFWQIHGRTYALIGQDNEEEFLEYAAVCVRLLTHPG